MKAQAVRVSPELAERMSKIQVPWIYSPSYSQKLEFLVYMYEHYLDSVNIDNVVKAYIKGKDN